MCIPFMVICYYEVTTQLKVGPITGRRWERAGQVTWTRGVGHIPGLIESIADRFGVDTGCGSRARVGGIGG